MRQSIEEPTYLPPFIISVFLLYATGLTLPDSDQSCLKSSTPAKLPGDPSRPIVGGDAAVDTVAAVEFD